MFITLVHMQAHSALTLEATRGTLYYTLRCRFDVAMDFHNFLYHQSFGICNETYILSFYYDLLCYEDATCPVAWTRRVT